MTASDLRQRLVDALWLHTTRDCGEMADAALAVAREWLADPATIAAVAEIVYPNAKRDGETRAAHEDVAYYLASLASVVDKT